jgi:uncharacterized protein (TIGR02453 family)
MAFRGWPVEALEFFEGLEADNSKSYWQANKATYETLVRAPMEELVAELEPAWGDGHIFRPYRDVRFSADKSPYKTSIAAVVGDGYIQLTANGLGAGSGMYQMAADQLERYRQAVTGERAGAKLISILDEARGKGIRAEGHDMLKTAPKGYSKDHPRIEFLRYKGLITWKEWPPGPWLGTRRAKDRIVEFLEASKPLNAWLRKHVGKSELPEDRRR